MTVEINTHETQIVHTLNSEEEENNELIRILEKIIKGLDETPQFYFENSERDIRKDAPKLQVGDNIYNINSGKIIGKFRQGPIHGVHKEGGGDTSIRFPKTIQEKRFNTAHEKYVRGKRKNLPSDCDDKFRQDQRFDSGVSWKRRVKTRKQWGGTNQRLVDELILETLEE